jgi:hypothetical protein
VLPAQQKIEELVTLTVKSSLFGLRPY